MKGEALGEDAASAGNAPLRSVTSKDVFLGGYCVVAASKGFEDWTELGKIEKSRPSRTPP